MLSSSRGLVPADPVEAIHLTEGAYIHTEKVQVYRLVVLYPDIMMIAQKESAYPSILKPQTLLHRKIWQCVHGRRGALNQRATSVFA